MSLGWLRSVSYWPRALWVMWRASANSWTVRPLRRRAFLIRSPKVHLGMGLGVAFSLASKRDIQQGYTPLDRMDMGGRGDLSTYPYTWLVCSVNMKNDENKVTYLDIRTAAERLGVNPETLRRWDRKGHITAYRTPGNYRRFRLEDVDSILKEREVA